MAICEHCKTEETQLYVRGVPICMKCENKVSPNRPPPPPTHEPPPQPDSN